LVKETDPYLAEIRKAGKGSAGAVATCKWECPPGEEFDICHA
jgi:hypothetical protein